VACAADGAIPLIETLVHAPDPTPDPALPRDSRCFAPVFVLAPARSFTSVVSTMVGQHPELAGLPELKLFAYPTIAKLEASLSPYWTKRGITHRSPGLVRALALLEFGDQGLRGLAAAREWLHARADWSGAQVLDVLLAHLTPREAVEKSPENVAADSTLQDLNIAYPRARYLHLTRHPLTTQASMARHRERLTMPATLGDPTSDVAAWCDAHLRILDFAAKQSRRRVLRVRAEDVLNYPVPTLRAIARWLAIREDDDAIDAMRHPEASPFAQPGPNGSGVIGGHDPTFLTNPLPRRVNLPLSVEQPPDWQGSPRLWGTTIDLARHLGYGTRNAGGGEAYISVVHGSAGRGCVAGGD
jgi:Sulfotransferase family